MSPKQEFQDYDQVITYQEKLTNSLYAAFSKEENPAIPLARNGAVHRLKYVLSQYAHLPGNIVQLLKSARDIFDYERWSIVSEKITKNIADEMGKNPDGTTGKSHYDRLMNGLDSDFGLQLRNEPQNPATSAFISAMMDLFRRGEDPCEAAGRIYALEYTAEPELAVVHVLLDDLHLAMEGTPLQEGPTLDFLNLHIKVLEPKHEADLRDAFRAYIRNVEERKSFHRGFTTVTDLMEDWWKAMVDESAKQPVGA